MKIPVVRDLEVSTRTVANLQKSGVFTIAELEAVLPKLHLLRNIGPMTQQEILKAYKKWKEDRK